MTTPEQFGDTQGPIEPGMNDPTLVALTERLDRLAASDEAAAPEGLEDRLLSRVGAVYAPTPIAIGSAARAWWMSGGLRAAAGLALVGGVGALIYAQFASNATPPRAETGEVLTVAFVEHRIDGMLAMVADEDGFADRIASIELWTDAITSDRVWIGDDLGDLDIFSLNEDGAL